MARRTTILVDSRRAEIGARAAAIQRRVRRVDRLRRAANGAFVTLGLFLALGSIDALWAAPVWLRCVFGASLGVSVAVSLWRAMVTARSAAPSAADAVGIAEVRACGEEGAARSAVELAVDAAARSGVAGALVDRVLEQGLGRLRSIELADVVDAAPMRRAAMRAGALVAAVAIIVSLAPRLVVTETLRLFDPFGDHPAYCTWRLTLDVDDADLRLGDDLVVELVVEPGVDAPAVLEMRHGDGVTETTSMSRDGSVEAMTRFTATILSVQGDVRIRGRVDGATTRWRTIRPEARPRVREATITIEEPSYAARPARTYPIESEAAPVALLGSGIRVDVTTSIEVGEVSAPDAADVQWSSRSAAAEWEAVCAGTLEVSFDVFSAAGLGLDAPIQTRVEIVEDAPPQLNVQSPQFGGPDRDRALATPASVNAIRFEAMDDVAVEGVGAQWRRIERGGASAWSNLDLQVDLAGRSVQARGAVSMETIGAVAGDRVELRFLARDARPQEFGGPNVTIAGPYLIDVISPEAHAAMAPGMGESVIPAPDDAGDAESEATLQGESEASGNGAEGEARAGDLDEGDPSSDGTMRGDGSASGNEGGASSGDPNRDAGGVSGVGDDEGPDRASGQGESHAVDERLAAPGDLRGVAWGSPSDLASAPIDPEVLNRLPRRARELIRRYYTLLARPEEP